MHANRQRIVVGAILMAAVAAAPAAVGVPATGDQLVDRFSGFLVDAIGGVPRVALVDDGRGSREVPIDVALAALAERWWFPLPGEAPPADAQRARGAVATGVAVEPTTSSCRGVVAAAAIRYYGDPEEPPLSVVAPPPTGLQLGCGYNAAVYPSGAVAEVAPWVRYAVACVSDEAVVAAWSDGASRCHVNDFRHVVIPGRVEYQRTGICWAGCVEFANVVGSGVPLANGMRAGTITIGS